MALFFVQHSAATATTGALIGVDLMDFGTATGVSLQQIKFGFGTAGVFNEVATGQGLPIATGQTINVQQMTTSTSPVSIATLPTTATLPVTVATNVVFAVQQMSTATSPVSVGTWTATGIVRIDTHGTATLPVSIAVLPTTATLPVVMATGAQVYLIEQTTTSTSPVSIASAVPLGVSATIPVSVGNTVTVNVANTATVAISGRVAVIGQWAHDATATVNQPVLVGGWAETTLGAGVADGDIVSHTMDVHGRSIVMPFSPRGNVLQYYTNVSGTTTANLATGSTTAGRFKDLTGLVVSNAATTTANISIKSSSTSTTFHLAVAGDGGGHQMHFTNPWQQAIAATDWVIALATQITGQLHISAQFHETT